ncbi:MAG: PhzF family phenazine biosynthesis protein [Chloroflexi bacterium]|uniref:PhzF family phenazine biosynthesis protein n=1 Tax=Candidatus Chlorohelix allophototropha TaxID=3003348 RepID=A0A8T7MA59_9CHLR|nr:PhzF family phenazine biosynthesis protein [Chloroflexota bacterium]WJW68847.1 PhzF family phenazine biosynthesis protein [Chloroflexota bacterium L227-S17]
MAALYEIDVFTRIPGNGNPACVILEAATLSEKRMRQIAVETATECAFVLPPTRNDATLRLRYFSPSGEMNLCGHATIGALWILAEEGKLKGECFVETQAGVLYARAEIRADQPSRITLQQPNPTFEDAFFSPDAVAVAIGLEARQIVGRIVSASAGRPKLLIPLPDYKTLDSCERNDKALEELCKANGLTGLYPYTCQARNPGVDLEARQFPYGVGFVEDPVTGVAMAALGGYLVSSGLIRQRTHLVIEQGHALGCPGRAEVDIGIEQGKISRVLITGEAVRVGKSEI